MEAKYTLDERKSILIMILMVLFIVAAFLYGLRSLMKNLPPVLDKLLRMLLLAFAGTAIAIVLA